MTAVITGAHGFLGWHLRCRLRARGLEAIAIGRDQSDWDAVRREEHETLTVFHLAGVNRASTDDEVEEGNLAIARILCERLQDRSSVHLVNANTVHAGSDSAYGRGKRAAADLIRRSLEAGGGTMQDVFLPNLFGEHGRPAYNSFVATFAYEVAHGSEPRVSGDREIPLLHAQQAAQALIDAGTAREDGERLPGGIPQRISSVLTELKGMHAMYQQGELPDLSSDWSTDLFNTYRSYVDLNRFPLHPPTFDDPRGRLFETVRMNGGVGQAYVSTTAPGQTRGEHWHLRKFERFVVVAGTAEISLRRLFSEDVVSYRVDGSRPGFVDMPTMWVHNITNVGDDDLVTMFWSDQLLDRDNPDQFPERVEVSS